MTHDDLREQVAALLHPGAFHRNSMGEYTADPRRREEAVKVAAAIIALVQADAFERAARLCDSLAETTYSDADAFDAATGCAAFIRCLEPKEPQP